MSFSTHSLRLTLVALVVSPALCACSSTSSPDPAAGSGIGGYGVLHPIPIPPDAGATANDGGAKDTGISEDGGAVTDAQGD
jgi:hypothetical protein